MISHIILDNTINQYSFNYFNRQELETNVDYVFIDASFSLLQLYNIIKSNDSKRLYGAIGSLTPDILAGLEMLNSKDNWNKGKSIFHKNKLTKAEAMILIGLLYVSW
jgi:hypothetical protein